MGLGQWVGKACSVPVFRYALERWVPDNYSVTVFHRGAFSDDEQSLIDRLGSADPSSEGQLTNLRVTRIDLDASPTAEAVALWESTGASGVPWVKVDFPWSAFPGTALMSGPLSKVTVDSLVDSPARREIARRLLKGESAVWVLLESGQPEKDEAAWQRLESRLEHLSATLELPVLNPADVADGLISIDEDELQIAFSTLRVSRNDPAESFFVENLLQTEDDLPSLSDPIAFPIFGRGRALYALVGDGISDAVIDEACVFLTGSCSCEVKEQNPGVDLVMSVDWENLVSMQLDVDRALPPLSGFAGLMPEVAEGSAELKNAGFLREPDRSPAPEALGTGTPILVKVLLICGILTVLTLGGAVILVRKHPHEV